MFPIPSVSACRIPDLLIANLGICVQNKDMNFPVQWPIPERYREKKWYSYISPLPEKQWLNHRKNWKPLPKRKYWLPERVRSFGWLSVCPNWRPSTSKLPVGQLNPVAIWLFGEFFPGLPFKTIFYASASRDGWRGASGFITRTTTRRVVLSSTEKRACRFWFFVYFITFAVIMNVLLVE